MSTREHLNPGLPADVSPGAGDNMASKPPLAPATHSTAVHGDRRSPKEALRSLIGLTVLITPWIVGGLLLIPRTELTRVFQIATWFDPLFFQYNVFLWLLFVILAPLITWLYTQHNRQEREARLRAELETAVWIARKDYIASVIRRQFGFPNYFGGVTILMAVVGMGLSVLFLLKPIVSGDHGLDYGRGANLFLLGGFMILSPIKDSAAYFDRIIISLTAFQFGFLGGYVYFIQYLVRSYFTLDLTPNTFVAMSVRMVTAGLVSLVLSFALPELPYFAPSGSSAADDRFRALLPVLSFGIGMFPDRGLLAINTLTDRVLTVFKPLRYESTPLSQLSGVSHEHEVRLRRQGYDSVENLAEANLIEMAVRTGFGYAQLKAWAGEAWLRSRFGGDDFARLVAMTGARTADQFKALFAPKGATEGTIDIQSLSADDKEQRIRGKIVCVARLVRDWYPY